MDCEFDLTAGRSRALGHQLRLDPARACNCRRKKQRQKDK
jgi:hypothetical protein